MYPARDKYRRPVVLPSGEPSRRPAARRSAPRRATGPATFPPAAPRSGKHCRKMLKASLRSLARLIRRPCSTLATLPDVTLMTLAESIPTGDGRRGAARRLAAKIARLRATA